MLQKKRLSEISLSNIMRGIEKFDEKVAYDGLVVLNNMYAKKSLRQRRLKKSKKERVLDRSLRANQ